MIASIQQGVAMTLLPLFRVVPLGKKVLFDLLPFYKDSMAGVEPSTRMFYDNDLGAWSYIDLGWLYSRLYYFYGRYPADSVPLLIRKWLNRGDVFVDIGAHWGVYTMAAARVVGNDGAVIAFEPNPASARIVDAHITINKLSNCRLYRIGLAAEAGELRLNMPNNTDSSWCTFRSIDDDVNGVTVPVHRADEVLTNLPIDRKVLVKIDTEGYEHQVIKGFGRLCMHPNIAFVLEVTDAWLRSSGTSASELFEEMLLNGFGAYYLRRKRSGLMRSIRLEPLMAPPEDYQYEVVFTREIPSQL